VQSANASTRAWSTVTHAPGPKDFPAISTHRSGLSICRPSIVADVETRVTPTLGRLAASVVATCDAMDASRLVAR
jgi:hypothetical protein